MQPMQSRWIPLHLTVLLVLSSSSGCSKKTSVVPVTGKVYLGSEVITSGQVTFIPMEETGSGHLSAGSIDANGEYKIFTDGKHGAPPGKYKVTVSPAMKPTPDGKKPTAPFDPIFMDSTKTTLQVEVKSDAPQGAYNLILTK